MKITGIIPARFASTRFPGKPLTDINSKTMIRRVYEQASKSKLLQQVIVATDDERIMNEVRSFGGLVVMTSANHQNGTERCAEAASAIQSDIIINIQGDEPFIYPEQIDLLAGCFIDSDVEIATLIKPQQSNEELLNPARIKVVINNRKEAMYFSRSIIPFERNQLNTTFYKHIGIYGFKKDVLAKLVVLKPTILEETESLEQLRWLENGYRIKCAVTDLESISIDTPEDLLKLKF